MPNYREALNYPTFCNDYGSKADFKSKVKDDVYARAKYSEELFVHMTEFTKKKREQINKDLKHDLVFVRWGYMDKHGHRLKRQTTLDNSDSALAFQNRERQRLRNEWKKFHEYMDDAALYYLDKGEKLLIQWKRVEIERFNIEFWTKVESGLYKYEEESSPIITFNENENDPSFIQVNFRPNIDSDGYSSDESSGELAEGGVGGTGGDALVGVDEEVTEDGEVVCSVKRRKINEVESSNLYLATSIIMSGGDTPVAFV